MAERVRVREIANVERNKLLSIIRRGSGSVVRWRRAQMVLWSAQGMDRLLRPAIDSADTRCGPVTCSTNDAGVATFRVKHAMPLHRPLSSSTGAGRLIS
jgi:hypothetical protein